MNAPQVIELYNQRLLTTEQLAEFYGASEKQIQDNFQNNKDKFIEGKHYYHLKGDKLKEFKSYTENIGLPINKFASQLILYTKQGASRHSKMLGTDRAWDTFDMLEENYFNQISHLQLPSDPMEILRLTFEAQQHTNERVEKVETRITDLEENSVLPVGDYNVISDRVNKRVSEVSRAYGVTTREGRTKLFKDINGGIKVITGVGRRTQLRVKHYGAVMDYINDWEPSTATKTIVRQMALNIEEIA